MEFTIPMNDEAKMPISEREAEGLYPTQHREGTEVVRVLDRDTDDLQEAYMRGRTAEPCEEQVEAATRERSRHQIVFAVDGIRKCCSCGAAVGGSWGDDRVAFERHVTMMMLEAARKAVM